MLCISRDANSQMLTAVKLVKKNDFIFIVIIINIILFYTSLNVFNYRYV